MDRYLTTEDLAEHYRTSSATVRYWRHIGYGPAGIKVGRRVLYPEADIVRFDAERRSQAQRDVGGDHVA